MTVRRADGRLYGVEDDDDYVMGEVNMTSENRYAYIAVDQCARETQLVLKWLKFFKRLIFRSSKRVNPSRLAAGWFRVANFHS